MHNLKLKVLEGQFSIHRLSEESEIPHQVFQNIFFAIVKTDEELSIVCSSSIQIQAENTNSGWSCFKVLGPLDFSLTGILAKISTALAESKISIFAVSTFNTDYILVESSKLSLAKRTLSASGYIIAD
ncbi:MAG: ACT domain-containing protein [Proteobacteria bacterium]|jgi:hypothetical protein|nr:ACT domain-containing protein [Desulfocapsa sp.]MBU3943782.1 ACT domain-containing protein [Pseudomonadota bacterium]MCG2744570.1 ACT domain-containing protein [Desulfobacteraceae bacterium]MDO8946155.1 ACT domain-containing protein [Desulfocapsaceae bacterium]MBU4027304.1 ACT domain-containing protein [Pseudomonadota bacterium]